MYSNMASEKEIPKIEKILSIASENSIMDIANVNLEDIKNPGYMTSKKSGTVIWKNSDRDQGGMITVLVNRGVTNINFHIRESDDETFGSYKKLENGDLNISCTHVEDGAIESTEEFSKMGENKSYRRTVKDGEKILEFQARGPGKAPKYVDNINNRMLFFTHDMDIYKRSSFKEFRSFADEKIKEAQDKLILKDPVQL